MKSIVPDLSEKIMACMITYHSEVKANVKVFCRQTVKKGKQTGKKVYAPNLSMMSLSN